jgi:hypothetical protein
VVVEARDFASNVNENLEHYARLLQRSRLKRRLFEEVYRGPKPVKTKAELATRLDVDGKQILDLAKPLTSNHLFESIKVDGRIAFKKFPMIAAHKKRILALSASKEKLDALPTKRKAAAPQKLVIKNVAGWPTPRRITIDDVVEFAKVRKIKKVPATLDPPRLPEATVKKGIAALLGESDPPKDWGGEQNDLFSTNVTIKGRRRATAFALKGPAVTSALTPRGMGKNGDQIQRLVNAPSVEAFFIQYEGPINQGVLDQLHGLVLAKGVTLNSTLYFGLIDRRDTYRLRLAYPTKFGMTT